MATRRNSTRGNVVEFKGLRDAGGLDEVPFGAFAESFNVDITRESRPVRRPGRTKMYTGGIRKVWGDGVAFLFVTTSGELRQLNADESTTLLRSSLPSVGSLVVARVATTLYWACGTEKGVVENGLDRVWGMPQLFPAGHVELATSGLPAGRYRYAWAGVTAENDEGPIGTRGIFETTTSKAVELVPPVTTHARITKVRAYVSEPNGTQLYRLADVTAPANAGEQAARHVLVDTELASVRPAREDMQALPPLTTAGVHNGRLVGGYGNLVLFSDRFDYEYFEPQKHFIPFSSKVVLTAPVESGVFVATETDHYFLSGSDIEGAKLAHKASYGAVADTLDYLEQKEHGFEGSERTAVWTGARGPVFGLPNGSMEDVGDGVVSFPSNVVMGAGAIRKTGANTHYISVLRRRG